jgi:single-strand selective monofunctional uracil DNA glycosylase
METRAAKRRKSVPLKQVEKVEKVVEVQEDQTEEEDTVVSIMTVTMSSPVGQKLADIAMALRGRLQTLKFKGTTKDRVTHVYNPLEYAIQPHLAYLEKFGTKQPKMMLIGMNPGPWGMSQTGVPFGEISSVVEFLQISKDLPIGTPPKMNLNRKIEGFECSKSEVSGKRLWGFMKRRFETAEEMSKSVFIYNYCPLAFMGSSGVNIIPEKLSEAERTTLFEICDASLTEAVMTVHPDIVCGIGVFTGDICLKLFSAEEFKIGMVQHPSPAGPGGRVWESASNFDELVLRPTKYFKEKKTPSKKRKRTEVEETNPSQGNSSPPTPVDILLSEIESHLS